MNYPGWRPRWTSGSRTGGRPRGTSRRTATAPKPRYVNERARPVRILQ